MFVVPSPWGRLESVQTLPKRPTASGGSSSSRESPPASRRLSFHEENLRLSPPRRNMTAGSLLLAVRSSCLQTFRRPQLLLAAFPHKVRPSWVLPTSLSGFHSPSRALYGARSAPELCVILKSLESKFHWVFFFSSLGLLSHAKRAWATFCIGSSPTFYCLDQRRHTLDRLPDGRGTSRRWMCCFWLKCFFYFFLFFLKVDG